MGRLRALAIVLIFAPLVVLRGVHLPSQIVAVLISRGDVKALERQ